MKDIQIWGTDNCSYCKKAKELLETHRFQYDYIDALDEHVKFSTLFPNATTVPQIIFRGEHVGGYDGLCKAFEEQNIFIGGSSF